jgi:hypothetical protein
MGWKCICGTVNDDKWSRCVGCNGEFQNEYKIVDTDKHQRIINYKDNVDTPIKIEPNYGLNIGKRITGLLFGISMSLLIFILVAKLIRWTTLSLFMWKYLVYFIIISGIVGFLLGYKYYKHIRKVFDLATQKD